MNRSGFTKNAAILFAITLMSGFLLGGVYQLTKKPIELATITASNKIHRAVLAEVETFNPDEALTTAIPACSEALAGINFGDVEVENALKAVDVGGSQLGYVTTSPSNDSYGDVMRLSAGLKDGGTITGIEFLETSDTPGLGLKAKGPAFRDQYAGKNAPELSVIKSDGTGDAQINAISDAIITSSATTNAINTALYYLHNCTQ